MTQASSWVRRAQHATSPAVRWTPVCIGGSQSLSLSEQRVGVALQALCGFADKGHCESAVTIATDTQGPGSTEASPRMLVTLRPERLARLPGGHTASRSQAQAGVQVS